jgi:hypothetical protein
MRLLMPLTCANDQVVPELSNLFASRRAPTMVRVMTEPGDAVSNVMYGNDNIK